MHSKSQILFFFSTFDDLEGGMGGAEGVKAKRA